MSRIWADGVDWDKRTSGSGRRSVNMSRDEIPNLNQCGRVGTDRDSASFVVQRRCCGRPLCAK